MNRRALLLLAIAWSVLVFILCTIPPGALPALPALLPGADKLAHAFLFLVMGYLPVAGRRSRGTSTATWRAATIAILCCTLYGGAIELLQEYYFHRSGYWADLLADAAGATAGSVSRLLRERRRGLPSGA